MAINFKAYSFNKNDKYINVPDAYIARERVEHTYCDNNFDIGCNSLSSS